MTDNINHPYVGIILVNYNSHDLLIECLESIYRIDYENFHVVIVENSEQNQNNEIETLTKWLKNDIIFQLNQNFKIFNYPLKRKPDLVVLSEEERFNKISKIESKLIIIKSKKNRGFAGGCNLGIDYIKAQECFEFIWLLNTDTVVERDSLLALVDKANESDNIIAVSSKLRYYDQPERINLIGGKFSNSIIKFGYLPIGLMEIDTGQYDKDIKIDTPAMASCLINLKLINEVGLMREDYFLYSEDVEWFERMKKKGFEFKYEYKSLVYHKESATTSKISEKTLYYYVRNKIHFFLTYYPETKYKIGLFISLLRDIYGNAIKRWKIKNLIVIIKAIIDGLKNKLGQI